MLGLLFAVISCSQKPPGGIALKAMSDTIPIFEKGPIHTVDFSAVKAFDSEARWLMYCVHCDDTPIWRPAYNSLAKQPLGFLNLKFEEAVQMGDTVECYYQFYYNDTLPCGEKIMSNYHKILDGIGFNKKTGRRVWFIRGNAKFTKTNPASRYDNALQPEVISFIKKHQNQLNPWFYTEAKKRGVL